MHPCILEPQHYDYRVGPIKQVPIILQGEDRENKRCMFVNSMTSEIQSPSNKRNRKNPFGYFQQPGIYSVSHFSSPYNIQEYPDFFITHFRLPIGEDHKSLTFQFLDDSRKIIIRGRNFSLPILIDHPHAILSYTTYRVLGPELDFVELFTPKYQDGRSQGNTAGIVSLAATHRYRSEFFGIQNCQNMESCDYLKVPFALESKRFKRIVTSRGRRRQPT